MTQRRITITIGYDPELAGPGFTVNGVASFDLASAITFACDLLRHQGAPVSAGLKLPVILAAPDLFDELEALVAQVLDACGAISEYYAMPVPSLRDKLPVTVVRLKNRIDKAKAALAKAELAV